jgi:hypothetical protein
MPTPEELFASQFPITGRQFSLELAPEALEQADGQLYATARVFLFDDEGACVDVITNRGPALSSEQLAAPDLPARLAAWRADVAARELDRVACWLPSDLLPSDYPPEARAARDEARYQAWREAHAPHPAAELRTRAAAAVAAAFERFPAVSAHVSRVFGLKLPRHVAVAKAFFDVTGAARDESPFLWLGFREGYLLDAFEPGALDREVAPHFFDERIQDRDGTPHRAAGDPPEMVTVMKGIIDGLHWGLWFDDPRFVPSFVVHSFANDDPKIYGAAASVLAAIRHELTARDVAMLTEDTDCRQRLLLEYCDAFAEADAQAVADDAALTCPYARTEPLWGSPGVAAPDGLLDEVPVELADRGPWRLEREDVGRHLDDAREALARQRPVRALAIARVLDYVGHPEYRADVTRLLVDAYRGLGREALAEIARVHRLYKDTEAARIARLQAELGDP